MSAATALTKARSPHLSWPRTRYALLWTRRASPIRGPYYFSADFVKDLLPALKAAARAANCLQIAGCTASGLFTADDWVLITPAATAMVLGDPFGL